MEQLYNIVKITDTLAAVVLMGVKITDGWYVLYSHGIRTRKHPERIGAGWSIHKYRGVTHDKLTNLTAEADRGQVVATIGERVEDLPLLLVKGTPTQVLLKLEDDGEWIPELYPDGTYTGVKTMKQKLVINSDNTITPLKQIF